MSVTCFTVGYLSVASFFAATNSNWEFVLYIGVVAILGLGVLALHRRVQFSVLTLWLLSIWGLAHMLGGLLYIPESWPIHGDQYVLYNLWIVQGFLKFDQVVHAFGFGVATWACWQGWQAILGRLGHELQPQWGALILTGAAGMGFGAMNEVIEFGTTLTLPETNVGGYYNTGWDLVANLVGVTIVVLLIRWDILPRRSA